MSDARACAAKSCIAFAVQTTSWSWPVGSTVLPVRAGSFICFDLIGHPSTRRLLEVIVEWVLILQSTFRLLQHMGLNPTGNLDRCDR